MEMCPFCNEIRNVVESSSTRKIKDENNKEKEVVTLSYHCEKCHQFIRSQDQDAANKTQ